MSKRERALVVADEDEPSGVRCVPESGPPLTLEEAFVVLDPYFEVMRDEYKKHGLVKVKRTRFFVAERMHDTERHFAACKDDGSAILVAPELAEMPDSVVWAILAHEFGHATDFLYPGEFVLGRDREPALRRERQPDAAGEKQWSKWLKAWHKRSGDVVELTADAIAERVMGVPYGYLGPCWIQSFDATRARPMGLR